VLEHAGARSTGSTRGLDAVDVAQCATVVEELVDGVGQPWIGQCRDIGGVEAAEELDELVPRVAGDGNADRSTPVLTGKARRGSRSQLVNRWWGNQRLGDIDTGLCVWAGHGKCSLVARLSCKSNSCPHQNFVSCHLGLRK